MVGRWLVCWGCDPGAPFFCASAPLSDRIVVLGCVVASGVVVGLPLLVLPVRVGLRFGLVVVVSVVTVFLVGVGLLVVLCLLPNR